MLAANTVNYMRYVACDLLGYTPETKLYTPDGETHPTEWLVRAPGQILVLARHMTNFGYTVTGHDIGWIGISGDPSNTEAVRDLEIRSVEARARWLRTAPADQLHQLTRRF